MTTEVPYEAVAALASHFHDDEPCDCMKSPHADLLECRMWADNIVTCLRTVGFTIVPDQAADHA